MSNGDGCEDWGDLFDDQDSEYWENYLSGPDDDQLESYYESFDESYGEEDYDEPVGDPEEEWGDDDMDEEEGEKDASRKEEIVEWLSCSELARPFRSGDGFFIPKGPHVRLKDGSVLDLIDWLFHEGIKGGVAVAGYSVVYSKPGSKYGEKLSFLKIVIDAPFSPKNESVDIRDLEDDIPF